MDLRKLVYIGTSITLSEGCVSLPPPGYTASPLAAGHMTSSTTGERVYLIDRWGERFDITHAVERYGMRREWFGFGIGKNAIPPLDHPPMIAPGEGDYPPPGGGQEVIGVQLGGEARSYPINSLVRHEIANETIGHTQAAVAYWPLVNLAAVYSRQLDGQTLTLAPSGWTYRQTFVLYDRETGTLWYPFPGTGGLTGISGPLQDRFLPEMESTRAAWKDWHQTHPQRKYMRPWRGPL